MNIAIIVSKKDEAGMNIRDSLLAYDFKEENGFHSLGNIKLYTVEKESIYCEDIDKEIDADLFIFATKHESASKVNSLSVHSPGNWGEAKYGGKEKQLCIAPEFHLKAALKKLEELNNLNYDVVQECTHHGPFLEKPCMFIEIGSSLEQWKDKKAADIIAKTIMETLTKEQEGCKVAIGIGGLHHTPNFKKIILDSDIAIGHICPKYLLEELSKELIEQAVEKSTKKAELAILDWKGLSTYKQKVTSLLEELNIPYKKVNEIKQKIYKQS
ncbi:MAG: D-tyrosyl-tRNA(Tyr) deacylase [bacterium]|nr:D-tyrosyl-tRNA(Tyr) deacylase [bacterium]